MRHRPSARGQVILALVCDELVVALLVSFGLFACSGGGLQVPGEVLDFARRPRLIGRC